MMMTFLNVKPLKSNNIRPITVANINGYATKAFGITAYFNGWYSSDPDGGYITAYEWTIDGVVKGTGATFNYVCTLEPGKLSKTVTVKLRVRDDDAPALWSDYGTRTITVTLSGRTEYYLTDHLGSIRTTIDQNGTVIGFDDYDPFGNVLPGRSYNAGTPNDLNKFTGHERDQEGGLDLDYMLARNYDSELGRFYSVDPLLEYDSPFVYVGNNPINHNDPTGLSSNYIGVRPNGTGGLVVEDNDTYYDVLIFVDFDRDLADKIWANTNKVNSDSGEIASGETEFSVFDMAVFSLLSSFSFDDLILTPESAGVKLAGKGFYFLSLGKKILRLRNLKGLDINEVLQYVQNPKLRNAILALWKPSDEIAGGTAGAIRKELESGNPTKSVFHGLKKGPQSINALDNILKNEQLTPIETEILHAIRSDLKTAEKGK